jgi:hypothetical protein
VVVVVVVVVFVMVSASCLFQHLKTEFDLKKCP